MSTKPTPEALARMGMEYNPATGLIQKIGTITHPDVIKAEERAVNKPKPLSDIEGYSVFVDGEEWAEQNEKNLEPLRSYAKNTSSSKDYLKDLQKPIMNTHLPEVDASIKKNLLDMGLGEPRKNPFGLNEKAIISVDPGTSGAICIFNSKGVETTKMPETPKDLYEHLKSLSGTYNCVCFLEKVQGLPGMGGSPMFNFGKGFGYLEMALIALNIPTVAVTPQKWQKFIGIGTKGKSSTTEWKNKLKAKAQQLFPDTKVFLWNADALLIGEYARNTHKW